MGPEEHPLTVTRAAAIAGAALVAAVAVIVLELASDHRDASIVWAVFAPAVIWSFVGTGLYAWAARPANRVGQLMVLLGFGWFLFTLDASNTPWLYTVGLVTGGLWGGVFLHLGLSFPSGRLYTRLDRRLVIAGYIIFPLAFVPALLFSGPAEMNCLDCPENVLLIRPDADLAAILTGVGAVAYIVLFALVLRRAIERWRGASEFERLQLTPVYVCSLGTFLLVTVARAGGGRHRVLGRVRRHRADAVRVPRRPAAQPRLAPRPGAGRADGGAARVARPPRRGRRRRTPTARARPPRRRAVAAGRARAHAAERARAREGRRAARGAARRRAGGAAHEPRRAARARPRHPPGGADRARARAGAAVAGGARPGAGDGRGVRRTAARPGRERGVLRRLRGARQRRQVRARDARLGDRRADQRRPHRRGRRRRRRRRRRRARLGPARARGPARRARRLALARQPGGPWHPPARAGSPFSRRAPAASSSPRTRRTAGRPSGTWCCSGPASA